MTKMLYHVTYISSCVPYEMILMLENSDTRENVWYIIHKNAHLGTCYMDFSHKLSNGDLKSNQIRSLHTVMQKILC